MKLQNEPEKKKEKSKGIKQLVFMPEHGSSAVVIDNRYYRLKREVIGRDDHIKRVEFVEFDKEEYEQKVHDLASEILETSGLTAQMIIEDVLKYMSLETLNKIDSKLKKGVKPTIKRGCLSIEFGKNLEIPIVE